MRDEDRDEYNTPDEHDVCPICGDVLCSCFDCERCGGSGKVPAANGYDEYIGNGDMTCPDCGGDGEK